MAMVPGNEATVSGKKALPFLGVGCLLFSAGMGLFTYWTAQATTPYFKRLEAERRAKDGRAPAGSVPEDSRRAQSRPARPEKFIDDRR